MPVTAVAPANIGQHLQHLFLRHRWQTGVATVLAKIDALIAIKTESGFLEKVLS